MAHVSPLVAALPAATLPLFCLEHPALGVRAMDRRTGEPLVYVNAAVARTALKDLGLQGWAVVELAGATRVVA